MSTSASSKGVLLSLFEQHYGDLVRYIARRTGNVEEARGLAHDTWLRIAERDAEKKEDVVPDDPRAYLFTISHNLTMSHLHRGSWMQRYLTECEQMEGALPTQTPDVAEGMMYRQAVARVEAALKDLPSRTREIYLAHGLHGEKQVDIALRMGVSIDTVKRDVAQATRCIEECLHVWRHTSQVEAKAVNAQGGSSSRRSRRKSLTALLSVFTLSMTGTAVWRHLESEALRFKTTLATLRGKQLHQNLPDGSVLTLDAQSHIEVDFSADRRLTRLLAGAAFFEVRRDENRPFVVQARDVQVTVLGTRFGVEIDASESIVVQVESGRVRVDTLGQSHVLTAGQSLRVQPEGTSLTRVLHPSSWRDGRLDFDTVPLAQVLARIQRYSAASLRATPSAASLPISGTVHVTQAQGWLKSLPGVLPVRINALADGSIEVARR